VEDSQLFSEGNFDTIVIEEAAEDMAVLDYSHHFHHEIASHTVQDSFEEGLIVVQLECELELVLEASPNCVVFTCACRRF